MDKINSKISIAGRLIGLDYPPYVIAEMSANHDGSIDRAYEIIKAAKLAGADALKMQTYTPDTLTIDCELSDFQLQDGLWGGRSLYDLYSEAYTPWDWHKPIFDFARSIGITIFSTPFDNSAVDLLEDLNVPAYKIASFEVIDLPLIRYAASTKKPLIISTGMATLDEVVEAIETAKQAGSTEVAVLHCVSSYPAPPGEYNLRTMVEMGKSLGVVIGLSDHTLGSVTAISAIALGGAILEKHFTLSRLGGGPDDSFSIEPEELKNLCQDLRTAWEALGLVSYGPLESEKSNIKFRRSLYFVENIRAGTVLNHENIRSIRPGFGLPPKYIDQFIGKKITRDILRGMPVLVEHLSDLTDSDE